MNGGITGPSVNLKDAMKLQISFLVLVGGLLLATNLSQAAPGQPKLVGWVYPSTDEKPYLWLGGAYFSGKGWRSDVQSKWALYPGTRWQLFGLDGAGPVVTSDKGEINDIPQGYMARLRETVPGDKKMVAIADADASAQPRLPRMQSLNQEVYQRVAGDLLRAQGLNVARAKLTQLMRVDLNGDGVEEVLIAARSRPDYGETPPEKRGDYALLALRYVDRGQVKAVTLASTISLKDVAFSAPTNFEVQSCVDVDGDGRMEIVGANNYYEGDGFDVWQFDGKSVKRVISAGWGV